MPKAAVAGGEIHYEEAGSGQPLIFVSGLGGMARSWQPQIAAFSAHYRVIIYDQRGTGASDRLQRVFSIDQMTDEVTGLMDASASSAPIWSACPPAGPSARRSRSCIRSAWRV